MVNKKRLAKAVINAGGTVKFGQAIGLSPSTISRHVAKDGVLPRLSTVSKLQQGIKLYAVPIEQRVSGHRTRVCGPSLADQLLHFAAKLELSVRPDQRDGFAEIRDQFLELVARAEQQELRFNGV